MNTLYYGDNLDVLRRYFKAESIDLVYLDPPFKSDQNYNVLFAEQSGARAAAQIKAFEDTWRWDQASAHAYQEVVEGGGRVSLAMQAFRTFLGENDLLAYLSMMAPRLVELRRVLKASGSLYLHCDPSASHYLKQLLDAIFGPQNFRNEVTWKRTSAHGNPHRWGPVHDVLLFYTKGESYRWTPTTQGYEQAYLASKYRQSDERGQYMSDNLTGAGLRQGDSGKPWRDFDPSALGRHWAVPASLVLSIVGPDAGRMTTQEKLDLLDEQGYILWPSAKKKGGESFPRVKTYLGGGVPLQDVITDIPPINSQARERLGYPTQKPVALLERILRASSSEGDTVLDPFCGCGTTVAAAQSLNRQWIGIDITHLAITLIRHRLRDTYGDAVEKTYEVIGEPVSVPDAQALADEDKYQFQWWALGLVGARPAEQKKGADKGIDGRLFFHDEPVGGQTKQIIISVKGGGISVKDLRDLRGVIDREKAAIGVLITMKEPTKPMRTEAASAGFYHSDAWGKDYPRLQLLTIAELLGGKTIQYPPGEMLTFKKAPKAASQDQTADLFQ